MKRGVALQTVREDLPRVWPTVLHELRLSDARAELLRDHYRLNPGVPGSAYKPCENPQQYGVDCGRCMRCRSIYEEGPLKEAP